MWGFSPLSKAACTTEQEAQFLWLESQVLAHPENRSLLDLYQAFIEECHSPATPSKPVSPLPSSFKVDLSFAAGHASNPWLRADASFFELTLADRSTLKVKNTQTTQASEFNQLQVDLKGNIGHRGLWFGQLLNRTWQQSGIPSREQASLSGSWEQSEHWFWLGGAHWTRGLDTEYQTVSAGLRYIGRRPIRYWIGLNWVRQTFNTSLYDQHGWQLSTGLQRAFLTVEVFGGMQLGENDLPGGDRSLVGGRIAGRWPAVSFGTLGFDVKAELSAQRTWEREGYSPYLANNRRRTLLFKRGLLRLSHAFNPRWSVFAEGVVIQQVSNLALFSWDNRIFSLGVRWHGF